MYYELKYHKLAPSVVCILYCEDKIIKMSDALSSNNVETETVECNCLVHARRKFVEIMDCWPNEASY